jgi:hypothetical protein
MDDKTYEIRIKKGHAKKNETSKGGTLRYCIKEGHARLMPDDIEQTMQNLWLIYYFLIILYLQ